MTDSRTFEILPGSTARNAIYRAIDCAPLGYLVKISPATRSLQQNAAQWPILECFAEQLQWPVNGHMTKMTPEEWKDVLTAAFKGEQIRLAMGLDGGVVMLGRRTSKFNTKQFSEWLEFLHATAAQRGVEVFERVAA
jgi:hypothetical protein